MRIVLIVLAWILLVGCGARKKSLQEESSELQVVSSENFDASRLSEFTGRVLQQDESFRLEPVDLERPIIIGRDTIHNTRIIYQKVIRDSVVHIRDTLVIQKRDTVVIDQDLKAKQLQVDRKGTAWPWAIILGSFVAILVLLYLMGLRIRGGKLTTL